MDNLFTMFLGEYKHALDSKNRLSLPSKFRAKLKGGAIITRGLDHCLFVFEKKEWEKLAEKLITLPLSQSNSRAFVRLMMAGAGTAEIDKQGRILIPEYLRSYSKLNKNTIIAGLYNRIEIWNEKTWNQYKAKTEKASDEIAERLSDLGI